MAVGLTPKYLQDLPLDELTKEQFLVLANETVMKTGWTVQYVSRNGLIAYTDRGILLWNAKIEIKIENRVASIKSESTGSEIMDWGKNKKIVAKFIANFEKLKARFTKEELDAKYQELNQQLCSDEDDILMLPPATAIKQFNGFFSIFKPKKKYFITPILINLNISIFILMAISGVSIFQPDSHSLLKWGANLRPMTLEGGWWRLITSCFLHIGILHLLMNMYALFFIGILLEPHLGRTRFIAAYILTGLTGSTASLWWNDLTISAGASGAIFGMYGVFLALLTTDLIETKTRKVLLTSILIFVAYNLINGLKGGIDNAAHIGGLVGGFIIGYTLIPSVRLPADTKLKFSTIGFLSALVILLAFSAYKKLPNDILTYDAKMKEFVVMETMALEIYKLPSNTPKEKVLYGIKDRGIYYWNENIHLLESFKGMDLPPQIRTRNKILKEYCEIRIKSYELLYKSLSEDTDQYKSQIELYNKQIESKLKELSVKK